MKKIILIAILAIVIVFSYGLISWNIFKTPTFISVRHDCFPKVIDDCAINADCISDNQSISLRIKYFGMICVTN
ncbi:MAG: hypothetical protein WCT26_04345 [Candidatus Buchananbacteria bacterium]|jgi:hypothetical protein